MAATAAPAAETTAEAGEPDSGVKIGDKIYEGPADFTITEAQYIRAHCDLTPQDVILGADEDPTNPDIISAVAWTVLHRIDPKVEWDDQRIGDIKIGEFWVLPKPKEGARPPGSRQKRSS